MPSVRWSLLLFAVACTQPGNCPPAVPSLRVVDPSHDGLALLSAVAERAVTAGAEPLVVVGEGLVSEGDRVGGFVALPKEGCVLMYARGSKGVGDLDLFSYADDGVAMASDESASADAGVLLCAPMPDRVYLAARVASGAGRVALGAQEVSVAHAAAAAEAAGARGKGADTGRLESWPGLEAKIAAHRRGIGSSWEDVRRFATLVDPRAATRTTVAIERGRCLDVLIVPSEEVPSLDVVAESDDGRIIARAEADGRDRSLVLCSESGDDVTISARPRGSSGLAAFVIARSAAGALPEIAAPTRVERVSQGETVDRARELLAKRLDPVWGKPSRAGSGDARIGSRTSLDLKLPAGCSRVDVLAGSPLGPLSAALWDAGGDLLAESGGSVSAALYACGKEQSIRVDVESRGRRGPFVVEARAWKDPPPEVMKRPLAAARLLGRVIGTDPVLPRAIEEVRPLNLEPEKLVSSSFVVAAGTCTEVVVAVEGGAGLDLRLVDESSGEDALGRGRFVASQRLCGNRTSRKARLELRIDKGPAKALVMLASMPDGSPPR